MSDKSWQIGAQFETFLRCNSCFVMTFNYKNKASINPL